MKLHTIPLVIALSALALRSVPESERAPGGAASSGSDPYLGEIMWVPFNFEPRGWMFCNGQLLPIESNAALFSLLGTTYGGDGRTTFALPDLRGRVSIHAGQGPGLSNRVLGGRGGAETVTLTTAQIPNHGHALHVSAASGEGGGARTSFVGSAEAFSAADPTSTADVISPVGGGQAHENMPPHLAMHAVIAVEGIYPSRR